MVYAEEPEEYITFCIHECRKEIEKYIDFRVRNGEKIKGSAQLIREKFGRNNTGILSKSKRLKIDAYYKFIQQALEVDSDT
ncbi:MAG: hypothetical protein ACPKPY_11820 [Nitrososphaeraceae archaeon]